MAYKKIDKYFSFADIAIQNNKENLIKMATRERFASPAAHPNLARQRHLASCRLVNAFVR